MSKHLTKLYTVKAKTDQISSTFCLAKWHHPTISLQTGQTNSCCHIYPHKISLSDIATDPSALHNTAENKSDRQQLQNGNQISQCNYCWDIEKLGDNYISYRQEWNASIYTPERVQEIVANPAGHINPQYIEVSFGNECNFKCGYCHPKYSSAYYKEIKDFGPYDMVLNHRNDINWFKLYEEENNPYVDAWWKWWPTVSKSLNILRITGGEPLLQQSTWRVFSELEAHPLPNLELGLNSNLGIKPILVERLTEKVKLLQEKNALRSFKLFTSIDTWGPAAEYIRTGLDLELWEKNFNTFLTNTSAPVTLMITFNALGVSNFKQLLEKILEWRTTYNWYPAIKEHRIRFDIPHLTDPIQYSVNILPKQDFMPYMYDALDYISENVDDSASNKFSTLEYEKFNRVVKYMETTNYSPEKLAEGRKDFYNWFTEHDRRRSTNFKAVFPEYATFYESCKTA